MATSREFAVRAAAATFALMCAAAQLARTRAVSRLLLAVLATALVGCVSAPAIESTPTRAIIPAAPTETAPLALNRDAALAVDFARTIGSLLYRHERAAEIARKQIAESSVPVPTDMLGFVTEQIDGRGTVQVSFVAGTADHESQWRAFARFAVAPAQSTQSPPEQSPPESVLSIANATLTEFERDKLRARLTAARIAVSDCVSPPRFVVLSWRQRGRDIFLAYRLAGARAPSTDDPAINFGGQHEFMLDARGRDLLRHRRSEPACTTLQRDGTGVLVRSASRDTPSPFDVYTSLQLAQPLRLLTASNNTLWQIDGDKVRALALALAPRPETALR